MPKIEHFGAGEHGEASGGTGNFDTRESWHLSRVSSDTPGRWFNRLWFQVPYTRGYLISVHGLPKRGSKGDTSFSPGDMRTYSKYITSQSLESYTGRITRLISDGQEPTLLAVANTLFPEWGWQSVIGVTIAIVEYTE